MKNWKITGIVATIVIVFTIPAYLFKVNYLTGVQASKDTILVVSFVGSQKCKDCHKIEYDKWQNSHHDLAMAPATAETVLGDFNDAELAYFGSISRFYRKEGKFFVHTRGPGGEMGDFEITYTFGYYPLQQYLVPFPGGRLQCLPIAWDSKGNKWFHLYPDAPLDPGDWMYWTNAAQTWNAMCADCHSTNVKKNYDLKTDSYQTKWSEINVSCEACHGPGSKHVEWAEMPDMARPQNHKNFELVVKTSQISSRELVELCAPCHSRRSSLGDFVHGKESLLDSMLPRLLDDGLYYADGQILEEVYVYGSFIQSKMYDRDVRCSDCHDVHSIKLVKEDNALCLQCHRASVYDTKEHHFHKTKGEAGKPILSENGKILFEVGSGAQCVQCHMPGRYYMGNDYRPDHSLRIPRPDLSISIDTPNACNRCHLDKTNQWSNDYVTKWYGPGRRPHYGTVLAAGHRGLPGAQEELIQLAGDPLFPVNVRATALSLLRGNQDANTEQAFERALIDEEPLIRHTAADALKLSDPQKQIAFLSPALYDPIKAVRIEAARSLAETADKKWSSDLERVFQAGLSEFKEAMEYTGDFAASRYNLANLYVSLSQPELAIQSYNAAIRIDDQFYPAKVNLAMLYNQQGKKDEAERLLAEVVKAHSDLYDIHYSLGLLLAEKKRYVEAAGHLQKAADGLPNRARVHYNLGLLLQYLRKDTAAEAAMLRAHKIEPDSLDYLYALADFYIKRSRFQEAKSIAEQMVANHPSQRVGYDLLKFINRELGIEK